MLTTFAPARTRKQAPRLAHSSANADACAILRKLQGVKNQIDDWVETHGEKCDCAFCASLLCADECIANDRSTSDAAYLQRDLAGLSWVLRITSELIESVTWDPKRYPRK